MHRVAFITIVPSPYQRDLFQAMANHPDIRLKVYYMEAASPDSPWPEKTLRPYEAILPGFWLPLGGARWHVNWALPDLLDADFVVLSSFTSWTGQRLMRRTLRKKQWMFWGERLRDQRTSARRFVQATLTKPLSRATAIVGIGREAERDYARRFPATRHFSVPYHCDLSNFLACSAAYRNGSPLTFLFCGQMIQRKGVDLLLSAFDQLIEGGMDARLLLVGREAELPAFLETVKPGTRSKIRYEGFQPPERLPDFFSRSHVFVLPSRHDGWGVVVNQALGAGLPIICSDAVGAAHDLVEPDVNGLVFRSENVAELFRSMERLANSPETVSAWGAASRRKAAQWLPEAGVKRWIEVFDNLENSSGQQ